MDYKNIGKIGIDLFLKSLNKNETIVIKPSLKGKVQKKILWKSVTPLKFC